MMNNKSACSTFKHHPVTKNDQYFFKGNRNIVQKNFIKMGHKVLFKLYDSFCFNFFFDHFLLNTYCILLLRMSNKKVIIAANFVIRYNGIYMYRLNHNCLLMLYWIFMKTMTRRYLYWEMQFY